MPFNWTLNPYRGCTHGCHYCFARRYQTQFELGPGDEFSSLIFVKTNLVEVLAPRARQTLLEARARCDRHRHRSRISRSKVTTSSHAALSRPCSAAARRSAVVTKGPMVVRDADLLAEIGRGAGCSVCLSVPTIDEDAWAALEPGTAHPLQRLRAVRMLRKAGVNAGVLMAPMVPGFTTERRRLENTIRAIADHDAAFLGANLLYLKGGTKDHFMGFLRQEFPHLVEGYERLYPGAYASKEYARAVRGLVQSLQDRYDLGSRRPPADGDERAGSSQGRQPGIRRGAAGFRLDWLRIRRSPPARPDRPRSECRLPRPSRGSARLRSSAG